MGKKTGRHKKVIWMVQLFKNHKTTKSKVDDSFVQERFRRNVRCFEKWFKRTHSTNVKWNRRTFFAMLALIF